MAAKEGSPWPLLRLALLLPVLLLLLVTVASSSPVRDAEALLKFKSTVIDNRGVLASWRQSADPPCVGRRSNWTGIFCGPGGDVIKLVLENMSLSGTLDVSPLSGLHALRSLSFMDNEFEGPIPGVARFVGLRTLYLSRNKLSGRIPDDAFALTVSLNKVHLARNRFSGPIPASLGRLGKLIELMLEENAFDGNIPEFRRAGRLKANLSNNELEGPIPLTLSKLNPSAFKGNKALCGPPLDDPCVRDPYSKRLLPASAQRGSLAITAIVILSCVALLALVLALFVLRRRRMDEEEQLGRPPANKAAAKKMASIKREQPDRHSPDRSGPNSGGSTHGKRAGERLVFVREGRERFELQDLLRASAEVLGSGSFGSSYKAVMLSGRAAVVKRFKEMNAVGREDFSEHMRRLGRLSHPNLLPLVAYYYRKEEKLLVFDYIPNGSLAHMLHGSHGPNKPKLDWSARLKIIKGVVRGVAYLHDELPMLSLPHGHLKSSNVLLGDSFEPLLTDYSLAPVTNRSHATQVMVAFKAPEVLSYSQTTKKADVWSLGILVLETVTGKFPTNYLLQGKDHGNDLADWVASVAGQEGEVFDKEMGGVGKQNEGEVTKLLRIGMACCESDPGKRMDLAEAMEKIEELKDGEAEDFASCISGGSFSIMNN